MVSKEEFANYVRDISVQAFNEIREYRDGNPIVCQRVVLDLTTGRGEAAGLQNALEIKWPLDSIFVEDATDMNTSVNVSFIDPSAHQVQNYKQLFKRDGMEFDKKIPGVILTWSAQASKTITLLFFSGIKFRSGNLTVINSGGVSITDGDTWNITNDATISTTAAVVEAANTSRKRVIIQNLGSVNCYLGGSGVTASGATRGLLLPAGMSVTLHTTAAIYAITAAGTTDLHSSEFQ